MADYSTLRTMNVDKLDEVASEASAMSGDLSGFAESVRETSSLDGADWTGVDAMMARLALRMWAPPLDDASDDFDASATVLTDLASDLRRAQSMLDDAHDLVEGTSVTIDSDGTVSYPPSTHQTPDAATAYVERCEALVEEARTIIDSAVEAANTADHTAIGEFQMLGDFFLPGNESADVPDWIEVDASAPDDWDGTDDEWVQENFDDIETMDEWEQRVEADLAVYAETDYGEQMFEELENAEDGQDELTISPHTPDGDTGNFAGSNGEWVSYDPTGTGPGVRPPHIGLHHELTHQYTFWNDIADHSEVESSRFNEGTSRVEMQAIGLPIDGSRPDADNPREGIDPNIPWELTDNGAREAEGYPLREGH